MISILAQQPGQFNRIPRPLVIGEVLFDKFPDGKEVLGGAPFNVAWNLRGLGQDPLLVSAVGHDESAKKIRRKMNLHGLDPSALQTNDYPTGKVEVSFDEGEPNYQIVPDQAYDFLSSDKLLATEVANFQDDIAIIYHGSLIWRSPTSRAAVETLRSKIAAAVFVDLNIRLPWFQNDQVREILTKVDSLKLNVDELSSLSGRELTEEAAIHSAASDLLIRYSVRSIWVTAGARGAYYFDNTGRIEFATAPSIAHFVDTVGAGDAFASVVIDGLLSNEPPDAILAKAVKFAAKVCELQGATTDDKRFYQLT